MPQKKTKESSPENSEKKPGTKKSKIVVLEEGNTFPPEEISSCTDCVPTCGGKSPK